MEPLSPITWPIRITAGTIILVLSTLVVTTIAYFQNSTPVDADG